MTIFSLSLFGKINLRSTDDALTPCMPLRSEQEHVSTLMWIQITIFVTE